MGERRLAGRRGDVFMFAIGAAPRASRSTVGSCDARLVLSRLRDPIVWICMKPVCDRLPRDDILK
eukprot:76373-Lingulodinium_polyedra.AAC.1